MNYGLIGEKLGHSFSKIIHEQFGIYDYDLKEIPRDGLDEFMRAKEFKGINVTIPYKEDVIKYLDNIDDNAKTIGAVNTIVNKDGKLSGYNTDYFGLKSLLEENGFELSGKKVLILGTGGTSKTAYAVAKNLGASSINKVSRSGKDGAITYEEAYEKYADADYIINTTPAGMFPKNEAKPAELTKFKKLQGVADVIYNPNRTRLLLEAKELGIKNCGGLKMLILQAVAACELFTGEKVSEEKINAIHQNLFDTNTNIVLTGMPGSGKSTIGVALAEKLGKEFIDTDARIEEREGRKISDIFATDGEPYFRNVEKEVIKEAAELKNCIISTGGGAILNNENIKNLAANGRIYFLDRKPEDLIPTDDRPLANEQSKIMKLYDERLPIYEATCDERINAEEGIDESVEAIISKHRV
ncbi:MAG: shikimate dehydrogenase [Lachnospiraceae bacterium]|nr:shikimate dehydrogenase [Lachnospiraceae bacterium]